MPPDIRTGLPAIAAGASAAGTAGQGPPGSDPLAALFASLLAQGGGSVFPAEPAFPKPRTGVKTSAPSPVEDDFAKLRTVKTATETTAKNTQTSAPLPILPPPLLTIQRNLIQMRPITPPTAGVTVGQKTMDTLPAFAVLLPETTSVKPDGELPLQGAGSNLSGASAQFPVLLITSPSLTGMPSRLSLPTVPATALPGVLGRKTDQPSQTRTSGSVLPPPAAVSVVPSGAVSVGAGISTNPSARLQTVKDSRTAAASLDAVILPRAFTLSADVTAQQILVSANKAPQISVVSPPALLSAPAAPAAYVPSSTRLSVPVEAFSRTFPGLGLGEASVVPSASPALPANPQAASNEPSLRSSAGVKPGLAEARQALGRTAAPRTTVNTVGIATDGGVARDGKPATEGTREDSAAMDGRVATDGKTATDGKGAMDGTATEGAQATEGILFTAGAASSAPDQNGVPFAKPVPSALPAEIPEKSLKSATASADNNTRTVKMLPPELTLQVVGKRSERSAASDTQNTLIALPRATAPTIGQTAKAEAKPLTPADRAEMVRQVAEGAGAMRLSVKPGVSEQMTLQLHPHDWGQLQVSVKITPSVQANAAQTVTAHIVAETPQVKAALESNSGDLRLALRASGLHLDRITVTVQSAGASAQTGTTMSSGSHHGMNGGAFGQTTSDQKTDMFGNASPGTPSFSAFTGSHGGRQGSQTPQAYTTPYQTVEPEGDEGTAVEMPRRLMLGGVDTRA